MRVRHDPALALSDIDVDDVADDLHSLMRHAIAVATLAPSGHNTQPWRFIIRGNVIELWADRSKALPVVDPDDRELVISCGVALDHLVLTLAYLGTEPQVTLIPDTDQPDLLGTVLVPDPTHPKGAHGDLVRAIPQRRTYRRPFEPGEIDESLVERLAQAASACGGWVYPVGSEGRSTLADLIADGDRIQMADSAFRAELARWIRGNRSGVRDGMRAHAFGVPDLLSPLGPFVVRSFDRGGKQASLDHQLALTAPLLLIVGTAADTPVEWVEAGRALSRVLLTATAAGASASFLNQPIEVATLRTRLREAFDLDGVPQLILRLGFGQPLPPQPRLDPDTVLTTALPPR